MFSLQIQVKINIVYINSWQVLRIVLSSKFEVPGLDGGPGGGERGGEPERAVHEGG